MTEEDPVGEVYVERFDVEALDTATRDLQLRLGGVVTQGGRLEAAVRALYARLLESPHAAVVTNGLQLNNMRQGISALLKTERWATALSEDFHRTAAAQLKLVRSDGELILTRNAVIHGQWTVLSASRGIHLNTSTKYWDADARNGVWTQQTIYDFSMQLQLVAFQFEVLTERVDQELDGL